VHRLNECLFGVLIEDIPIARLSPELTGTWQLEDERARGITRSLIKLLGMTGLGAQKFCVYIHSFNGHSVSPGLRTGSLAGDDLRGCCFQNRGARLLISRQLKILSHSLTSCRCYRQQ
jgi:hypothetical protein